MAHADENPLLPCYGVLAASHSHTRDFRTALHAHPFYSLFYIVAGKGFLDINTAAESKRIELSDNSAVLLEPGINHQIIDRPRNPMTLFVIYFSCQTADGITSPDIAALRQTPVKPGGFTAAEIRKQLRKILNEQSQQLIGYEASVISSLNAILISLLRTSPVNMQNGASAQKRVRAILEYIQHNFSQSYSLSDAAAEINLSERHFTNLCRKITGMSFRKYLEGLRLSRARELLETTNMPATAIAFEVGYEELSTFYRAFKAKFKFSPIAYKKLIER
ncbi:MAG TPA: AraC family transcriptional regulator [Phycisphaerae bacterium]|nr:AraC family transcriptional regulator [Phycisphaerae bacterium]HPS53312.1 AraC family transcriptional regulator [Phycisphaerae bacterium]